MPEGFENCIKNGGEVRRMVGPSKHLDLKANEWRNICYIKGKTWMGHVHTKGKK